MAPTRLSNPEGFVASLWDIWTRDLTITKYRLMEDLSVVRSIALRVSYANKHQAKLRGHYPL